MFFFLFCFDSGADHVINSLRYSLLYPGTTGAQLEKGHMGRYLTDTWHAAEAMGCQAGRMCSVAVAHIIAPCVGSDRLRQSPLVCTVVGSL